MPFRGSWIRSSILDIRRQEDGWSAEEFCKLPSTPLGIFPAPEDAFFVITDTSLILATSERRLRLLIPQVGWRHNVPHAISVDSDGTVYMAMHGVVGRIRLDGTAQDLDMLLFPVDRGGEILGPEPVGAPAAGDRSAGTE